MLTFVAVAALVLHIIWTWRSAHNARALGRTGARLSPGWAIGAWFVPLGNFVLVYLLYSDLWRSSDPGTERGDGWRRLPGSVLVRVWTVAYIGGLAILVAAIGLAVGGVTGVETTRLLLAVAGVVSAAGTVLSIVVVREITARQEVLQRATQRRSSAHSSGSTPRPPRSTGRAGTPTRAVATTIGTGTAPRGPST